MAPRKYTTHFYFTASPGLDWQGLADYIDTKWSEDFSLKTTRSDAQGIVRVTMDEPLSRRKVKAMMKKFPQVDDVRHGTGGRRGLEIGHDGGRFWRSSRAKAADLTPAERKALRQKYLESPEYNWREITRD